MVYIVLRNKEIIYESSSLRLAKDYGRKHGADHVVCLKVIFFAGTPMVEVDMLYVYAKNLGVFWTYTPDEYSRLRKQFFGSSFYVDL